MAVTFQPPSDDNAADGKVLRVRGYTRASVAAGEGDEPEADMCGEREGQQAVAKLPRYGLWLGAGIKDDKGHGPGARGGANADNVGWVLGVVHS